MAEYIPKDKVLELWWYWKFIEAYDKTAEMEGIDLGDYVPREWHDRVCEEMAKHHTADRPKGEWIDRGMRVPSSWIKKCSLCGYETDTWRWCNYCPNCGADMRGDSR